MHKTDGTFSGMSDKKKNPKHYFSYQYCISPFFPLHLGDKQKRSLLCFRIGYSSSHASREHTGDTDDGQMHSGRAVVHLHKPDNNSMESTQEGWGGDARGSEAFPSLQWRTLPPSHTASQWEEQKNKEPGPITWHISIQFPLQNVFIFGRNGMSFYQSLWSRIKPGIKTDFPGSNLPSSIDFFTLTEPVLPNLTWQHTTQWTREHLGD